MSLILLGIPQPIPHAWAVLLVESLLPPKVAERSNIREREAETIHVLIAYLSQGKPAVFQTHPAAVPVVACLGGCILKVALVCVKAEAGRRAQSALVELSVAREHSELVEVVRRRRSGRCLNHA